MIITVGRGHSGTSLFAHLLAANGVYMGDPINETYDYLGAGGRNGKELMGMLKAAKMYAQLCVKMHGDGWQRYHTPCPPPVEALIRAYVDPIEQHGEPCGFKLPETVLLLPWIIDIYPDAKYIFTRRNMDDTIRRPHATDELMSWGVPMEYEDLEDTQKMREHSYRYQNWMLDECRELCDNWAVDYDMVCDSCHTEGVIEGLGEFLGVDLQARIGDFEVRSKE